MINTLIGFFREKTFINLILKAKKEVQNGEALRGDIDKLANEIDSLA